MAAKQWVPVGAHRRRHDVHSIAQTASGPLTTVRLNLSIAQCRYDWAQNAERHLHPLLGLANLYSERALIETLSAANRCTLSLGELRQEYPDELVPESVSWLSQPARQRQQSNVIRQPRF